MSKYTDRIQMFSGSTLKIIAIITMLVDHIGAAILFYTAQTQTEIEIYHIFRNIGRVAFPIFCFLLVEGFLHTHDVKDYAIRLGIFAVLSEIPFDLAFTRKGISIWNHQNVFWTLFIALLVLYVLQWIETKLPATWFLWRGVLCVLAIAAGCGLAYFMRTDYDYKGVLAICVLYIFRQKRIWQTIAGALCFFWEPWAILGFLPILLYNGKRGFRMKYFFYLFYPLHLLALFLLAHFVMHLH